MSNLMNYLLTTTVLILLTVSIASAHGDGDDDPNDHMGGGHMNGGHMDDNDHFDMNVRQSGFEGYSDHMIINGNIVIDNAITLSISVSPSDSMYDMMDDGHMSNMGHSDDMMDYANMMNVSLIKLVEFEDVTLNGFSNDDLLVSEYILNSTTINEPVLTTTDTNNTYMIESNNNSIFTMIVELNTDDNIPYAWKWSLIINYPFSSSTSKIAILHEIDSQKNFMMDMDQNNMGYYDNNHMSDNHHNLPMYFSWDETALVDNKNQSITATSVNDIFALSIAQGSQIYYDPLIGVDYASIQRVNNILSDFTTDRFIDMIKSPTIMGLFVGSILLISLAVFAFLNKNKQGN